MFIIKLLFTQARIKIFLTIMETLVLYSTNRLIGPFYCISFIYKYSVVWPLIMLLKWFYQYFYLKLIAKGTECRKMTYCDYKNVLTRKGSFTKKLPMNLLKWPLLLLLCVLIKSIILPILKVLRIYLIPIEKILTIMTSRRRLKWRPEDVLSAVEGTSLGGWFGTSPGRSQDVP